MSRFLSRLASGLVLGLASFALVPGASAQQADAAFTTLDPAQPQDSPAGTVQVLEFFAYSCPHCNAVEPLVRTWLKDAPKDVVFQWVPVAFNAAMADQQKMFYTLQALDRMDLHDAFFKAIHEEHQDLFKEKDIAAWAAQHGIDEKTFTDAFNSFGVQTRATRANELTRLYQINGTPTFAVGGRYLTSPAQTNSYQGAVDEVDRLVKQLLAKQ